MKFIIWQNNKHWAFNLYFYLFFNYASTNRPKGRLLFA